MNKKIVGIYKIENIVNGKAYVGRSVNVLHRWSNHRVGPKQGSHENPHLQRAWNKYGEDAFSFSILERCSAEELTEREKYYIDQVIESDNYYNINLTDNSSGMTGRKHSEETKQKQSTSISKAIKAKWQDPEYREKMMNRPPHSEETKKKIGLASKRAATSEARKKISEKIKALRYDVFCTVCGAQYVAKSLNSQTCSHSCKLADRRAKRKAKNA